ncbi:MAG: Hsp20/alpha crystallin family protein [Candidatus Thiodiazotropha sp.]
MFGNLGGFENNLFDEFRHVEQELEWLLGNPSATGNIRSVAKGAYPPINIATNSEQVDVYLFAAGIDPASLDISIQRNILTVKGERKPDEKDRAAGNFYRKERFEGAFHRVVTLPDDVDPEKVEARYTNGVLRIIVMRHEAAKPRQIEIN